MNGTNNEFDFVLEFNNKKVKELNPLLRFIIEDIFYDISEGDTIKAWRNHLKQKSDILLNIKGVIKGISIKMGGRNSVHVEHIGDFCNFLYKLGATKEQVNSYIKYHYADGTLNGKGIERLSCAQYKKKYQKEIDILNRFLNTQKNVSKAIDRFVLKGNNSDYEIDGIIWGTPKDFLWISKKEIINIIMLKRVYYSSAVHFSTLVCQPLNRCLNYNSRYSYGRYYVQIKWYTLFDDIVESMSYLFSSELDNLGSN
ncbi:MAG: hypothetical protein ACI4OP_03630 [Candidatus Coprovivens sp.]